MSAAISGVNLRADNVSMARPMRLGPPVMTKPPAPGAAPIVQAATGLGSGGGVGLGANVDQAWGHLRVFVGLAPAASGSVVLAWPGGFPSVAIVAFCDWATLTVTTPGGTTVISWTALAPLVPDAKPLHIAYQWAIST